MIKLRAKDIMNTDVLSVGIDWSIDQLTDFLVENSISGAPVTSEDGNLLGVVSMTDIMENKSMPGTYRDSTDTPEYYIHASEKKYSHTELESYQVDTESLVTVRDIMTTGTFSVNEYEKIQNVADAMLRGRIHRVFVTRDKTLVGIITTMDMLRAIKDL